MKKDTVRSFALDSNIHNSLPVVRLRRELGAEGFGIYIMLLCRLRTDEGCVSERDYDSIAFSLGVDPQLVKQVVEDFGLFELTDNCFYSREIHRQRKIEIPEVKPVDEPEEEPAEQPDEPVAQTVDQLIDELYNDGQRMECLVNTHYIAIQQLRAQLTGTFRMFCRQKNLHFDSLNDLYRCFDNWLNKR